LLADAILKNVHRTPLFKIMENRPMKSYRQELWFQTKHRRELINITGFFTASSTANVKNAPSSKSSANSTIAVMGDCGRAHEID
jgi:hypothetical protein